MQEVVQNQYADTGRKLDTYNGAPHRDVLRWLEEFEDFAGSCNWSDTTKINKLPFYLKDAARDWYSSYVTNSSVPPRTWLTLKESLKNYFLPSSYNTYLRDRLHSAVQLPHQPVANYILEKKTLCFKLDSNMSETDIIHHILEGIDPEIAKVIYTANPDSVEKLLEVAKNAERGTRNLAARLTREAKTNSSEISDMRQMMIQMSSLLTKLADEKPSKQKVNFAGINDRNNTRNIDGAPQCFNCGKVGHTARFCRFLSQQRQRDSRNHVRFDVRDRPNYRSRDSNTNYARLDNRQNFQHTNEFRSSDRRPNTPVRETANFRNNHRSPMRPVVTEIDTRCTRDTELIYANLKVETMKMRCLIDTGSMVSIVRKDVAETFRKQLRPYKGGAVTSATGNKFTILGEVELNIYLNEYINDRVVVYALVVEDFAFEILLGNDFNRIAGVSVDCANKSVSFRNIACNSQADNENVDSNESLNSHSRSRRNPDKACETKDEPEINERVKESKNKSRGRKTKAKQKTSNIDFTESTSETDSDLEFSEPRPIVDSQTRAKKFENSAPYFNSTKVIHCKGIVNDSETYEADINEGKLVAKMQENFAQKLKNDGYFDWEKRLQRIEQIVMKIKTKEVFTYCADEMTDDDSSVKDFNVIREVEINKYKSKVLAKNDVKESIATIGSDMHSPQVNLANEENQIEDANEPNDYVLNSPIFGYSSTFESLPNESNALPVNNVGAESEINFDFKTDVAETEKSQLDYYDMYLDSEYAIDALIDAYALDDEHSMFSDFVYESHTATDQNYESLASSRNDACLSEIKNDTNNQPSCINVVAITPNAETNKLLLKCAVEFEPNEEKSVHVIPGNTTNILTNCLYACVKNIENLSDNNLKVQDDFIVFNEAQAEVKVKNLKNEKVKLAMGTCVAQCTSAKEENLKRSKISATHTTNVPFAGGEIKVGRNLTAEEKNLLLQDLSKFKEIFAFDNKKLGRCNNAEFTIDLIDDKPVRKNPYIYSSAQRKELQKQIDELIELGVVSPSRSPYASPVVLVKKADETYRMCVDLRFLNTKIKDDSYPMANVNDCLFAMQGAKYYATIDLNRGFHQYPIKKEDREKTAFVTQDGQYEFNDMPFGIKSAPPFFQRGMDVTFAGLKWHVIIIYQDDLVVKGNSFTEFRTNLCLSLQRLKDAGFTIKVDKCTFGVDCISFLGHIVDSNGIKMDPDKIAAIVNFPFPTTIKMLRSLLGLISFYRKFINNCSLILKDVYAMLKKNAKLHWGKKEKKALRQIIKLLTSYPVLCHFDPMRLIVLRTDASYSGYGAILLHKFDEGMRVIYYLSRLLSDSEKNYIVRHLEIGVLVWAILYLKSFLNGVFFLVETDHCHICSIRNKQIHDNREARWAMILQGFNFEIIFKSGRRHSDVDCLSRYPVKPAETVDNLDDYLLSINVSSPNFPNVPDMQRKDQFISDIRKLLDVDREFTKRELHDLCEYTVIDDVLYRRAFKPTPRLLLCIPESLIDDVLYSCHDDPTGGHFGFKKTLAKFNERFYIKDANHYILTYVNSCMECQTKKKLPLSTAGLLNPISVGEPGEIWGIDILGPFPKSETGNKYVIVATDHFTKHVECRAVPTAKSWNVAMFCIEDILCVHGAPERLISDRGLAFLSNLSENIYEIMNTKHIKTTAYHPQTNGTTEASNKNVSRMLSHYASLDQKDWDLAVPLIKLAHNTAVHSSTGFTPYYLMHGRDARLPIDRVLKTPSLGISDVNDYAALISTALKNVREIARTNIQTTQKRYTEAANKKRRNVEYNAGDLVLVFVPKRVKGKAEKLLHPYKGPFRVLRRLGNVVYEVEPLKGKGKADYVHVSRMKPFRHRVEEQAQTQHNSNEIPAINIENKPLKVLSPPLNQPLVPATTQKGIISRETIPNHSSTEIYATSSSDKESVEMDEEVKSQLRRSARIRNKPDRYHYGIFALLFALLFVVSESFERSSPIIWRKSEKKVVAGKRLVTYTVKYEKPCDVFFLADANWNTTATHEMHNWCETAVFQNFINPLKEMCSQPTDYADRSLNFHRQKREPITLTIIGTILIAGIATIGVSAFGTAKAVTASNTLSNIADEQQRLFDEIAKNRNNSIITKQILQLLEEKVENLDKRVDLMVKALQGLESQLPKQIIIFANLASRFMLTHDKIKEIGRAWKHGKVDPKFIDLFNLTFVTGETPAELAESQKCTIDIQRNLVTFDFFIPEIKKDMIVLYADPFSLVMRPLNESVLCRINYKGPSHVVYSKVNDCIFSLSSNQQNNNDIVLATESDNCSHYSEANTQKYWRSEPCQNEVRIVESDVVQVKPFMDFNYVYCYSFRIVVFNKEMNCPAYPFTLPAVTPFRIGKLSYNFNHIVFESRKPFLNDLSQRVNTHLMPSLHELEYKHENYNEIRKLLGDIKVEQHPYRDCGHHCIAYLSVLLLPFKTPNYYYSRKRCRITIDDCRH
ncbi:pol polyprotein-like protein [Leptotrombidium deliense]|uniref:RNA-directed DNA polymerase n=1 Tax=Leptotrombidium deliense TaxID=299467 RepID=A0A443SJS8_9ACAR|nr:pol polyprotein-like protein [Leptotrombidium deliense]